MKFTVYGKENCSYCNSAKGLLERKGLEYDDLSVPTDVSKEKIQARITEAGSDHVVRSVPQIFHGSTYVGGFKELVDYLAEIEV